MSDVWDIEIGEYLSREERRQRFGGATYGGIEPSGQTANVFVYSDPERGGDIYPYDGWTEDRSVFLYTGEGREGDQRMTHGNRAILDHESQGRALRVFVADGTEPGSNQKRHRYIGRFRVDPAAPYRNAPAPDDHGEDRTVFVFRLLPEGAVEVREQDGSRTGDAFPATNAELVASEQHETLAYEVSVSQATTARRREADLVQRFETDLASNGHGVARWRLQPVGQLLPLVTDTYDKTAAELYEAKGTTTRHAIRQAIGQLLDYRRHIDVPDLKLATLLPSRPDDDLIDLLHSIGISCVYESAPGRFERLTPQEESARPATE